MEPVVSLICTGYNRAKFLHSCFYSALAQTFTDFELIYVDDGSSDRSLEIAREFATLDRRIKIFVQPHYGRAIALKLAHDRAVGEYCGWIDADDLLHQDALLKTLEALNHRPTVGLCYTNYTEIDALNNVLRLGHRCQIPYSAEFLLNVFMTFHFRLYRRNLYDLVGGVDTNLAAALDYDLCLKLSEVTEFYHLPESLYFYRLHPDTMSSDRSQYDCAEIAIKNACKRRMGKA